MSFGKKAKGGPVNLQNKLEKTKRDVSCSNLERTADNIRRVRCLLQLRP